MRRKPPIDRRSLVAHLINQVDDLLAEAEYQVGPIPTLRLRRMMIEDLAADLFYQLPVRPVPDAELEEVIADVLLYLLPTNRRRSRRT